MAQISLRTKFLVLFGCLAAVFLVCNLMWSTKMQSDHMTDELVGQARGFAKEMDSVWEYISINQDRINYSKAGYEFKRMHCSVAGKAVAALFTRDSEYTVRYVAENPRNLQDLPDDFEKRALAAFAADAELDEFYEISDFNGQPAFRYCGAMHTDSGCLECHGSPAGEVDITGFPKEGWTVGALAGATSIVIPLEDFEERREENVARDVGFYTALLLCFLLLLFFGLRKLVTRPLHKLQTSLDKVGEGDFESPVAGDAGSSEVAGLMDSFNQMSGELKTMYGSLEDQVAARTEELERANDELAQANAELTSEYEFKSALLGKLSHELRTPLASMISLIEAERQDAADGRRDGCDETLERVYRSSMSLSRIVNGTLELLRIETGGCAANWEFVDVCDLVGEVASEVRFMAEEKAIDFRVNVRSDVALVYSDMEKMRGVLVNLLTNAIRYTPEGGEVRLSVCLDEGRDAVLFAVADTGMGISPDDLEHIFDKFYQGERASKMRLGNGMGLAIAKEFSQAIEGTIRVESTPGKGSTFVFTVPIGRDWEEGDDDEDHVGG